MNETNESPTRSRIGKVLGYLVLLLWLAGGALIACLTRFDDRGMLVSASAAALSICTLVTLVWFTLFGRSNRFTRVSVAVASFAAIVIIICVVRVEEVTGGMVPKLRFAWQPRPDEQLAAISTDGYALDSVDVLSTTPKDFPQFLGPDRTAWIPGPKLSADWESNPPRQLWKQPIGAGWCAFSIVNGYAVTCEQRGEDELVTCYDVISGDLNWAHAITTRHETVLGGIGPRATPTISEGRVYAVGGTGILRCLDGRDGSLVWQKDLVSDFGGDPANDGNEIAWGRSGSPLVFDDRVVVPVGGPSENAPTLVAYEKVSGSEVWRAGSAQASYSSPLLATLCGVEQIIYVAEDAVFAFSPQDGQTLWQYGWPGKSTGNANVSQPKIIGQNRVLLSKGYGQGAELIELAYGDKNWTVDSVWQKPVVLKTKFSNVVVHEGLAFGLDDIILECVEIESGRKLWKKGRYGFGQILGVGDRLLVQAEDGRVLLVDAGPKYDELASFQALDGKTWNNPALYGRYLLVRNGLEAACYELPVESPLN